MSIKTYAVFQHLGTMFSGNDWGVLCLPNDGEDLDDEYRTRFGYPESGSGPYGVQRHRVHGISDTDLSREKFAMINGMYTQGSFKQTYSASWAGNGTRWIFLKGNEITVFDAFKYGNTYGLNWVYTYSTGVDFRWRNRTQYGAKIKYQWFTYRWVTDSRTPIYNFDRPGDRFAFKSDAELKGSWSVRDEDYSSSYWTGSRRRVYFANLDLAINDAVYDGLFQVAHQYLDVGSLPGPIARGLETAYTQACANLPEAATNLAANILEAASLLTSLFSGEILGEVPKTVSDAWLSYRYVYTTTKLDVREIKSVFSRLDNLTRSNLVKVYGQYTRGGVQYRVGFHIDTAQIIPRDVSTTLQKFGLNLNLLNIWDMIPYSFVVDWFVPIGSIIEYFQNLDACKYEPKDIWWSISQVENDREVFVRLPGRKLSTLPYLAITQASQKTVFLRIADAIALFT